MRILITGGAGFIFSHVAKRFVERGDDVIIADRFTYAGKAKNIQDIISYIQLLIGDLSTGSFADRCASVEPDVAILAAAETHVDKSIICPEAFMISNAVGTLNLLQAFMLATKRPEKIIVISTDETFGPTPAGRSFDEDAPMKPSNAYAASKVAVEAIAHAFWITYKMPLMIVRPCNTYGTRQHPEKVIPKFVGQMLRQERVTLYNDGMGSRDWLHVNDHGRAYEILLENGEFGQAYNLAAEEEHSDSDIAKRINEILQRDYGIYPSKLTYVPGRPGHDKRYSMSCEKLKALGWKPMVQFDEGFRDVVHWNVENQDYWNDDLIRLK